MKGLAEFMTTEKVNLGLDDYNDEDFEDGFEETQPQTLSQVDLPKFRVEGFWGERLDKVLAAHLPDVSRARLAKLIENGSVKLNGAVTTKIRAKATEGDEIELLEPPKLDEALAFEPQSFVEFEVIYEDPSIIVVNKPAGLVVHPGAGNPDGTLLNGLLYHFPELKDVPRAGIVHRLDRDTTGLMVVARTLAEYRRTGLLVSHDARRADESGPPASGTHGQA